MFTKAKTDKAKYYAISFFNQLTFDADEPEVAVQVVLTYMKLFRVLINADSKPAKREDDEQSAKESASSTKKKKGRWQKDQTGTKVKPLKGPKPAAEKSSLCDHCAL